MKQTYIFLFLVFILHNKVSAQSQGDYSYSLGFNPLSIKEIPKLLNESRGNSSYKTNSLYSFTFKLNDNQMSYRITGSTFTSNDYSFKNDCENCESNTGKLEDFSIKIGFEKNITNGIIQSYLGSDIGYGNMKFSGNSTTVLLNSYAYHVVVDKNMGMISPFLGLKGNLFESRITISAEAGMDFIVSNDKETKSNTLGQITSQNTYTRVGFIKKPLGLLSVQYNFGRQ